MNRYAWTKADAGKFVLVDTKTCRLIASIVNVGRDRHWVRSTSMLIDGAPTGNGMESTLLKAKVAVLTGLMNEVET